MIRVVAAVSKPVSVSEEKQKCLMSSLKKPSVSPDQIVERTVPVKLCLYLVFHQRSVYISRGSDVIRKSLNRPHEI